MVNKSKNRKVKLFSAELEEWLIGDEPKTIKALTSVFAQKSYAVVIFVLMSLPALPIPTGGITHVLEIIVVIITLQFIIGRKSIWVPKKWGKKQLSPRMQAVAIPHLIRRIKWFERFSRPRYKWVLKNRLFLIFAGILMLIFTVNAFIAPPFTGLDTIPALSTVMIALAILLDDILIFIMGAILGSTALTIFLILGDTIVNYIQRLV